MLLVPVPSPEQQTEQLKHQESNQQDDASILRSHKLWEEAFSCIEHDPETKELVEKYLTVLGRVLGSGQDSSVAAAGSSLVLTDITQRQAQMAWLVKSGQEKIRKASKAAELAGSFAENILLIKPMGDFLIENIPQAAPAAIPWACVCMALEVSPANAIELIPFKLL